MKTKTKITTNTIKPQNIMKIMRTKMMINAFIVTIQKMKNIKYKEHFHHCPNHKCMKLKLHKTP